MRLPPRARGFSLIELAAALIVIGVFAGVLLRYAIDYAEQAEKLSMEAVASNVRAALHLRVAAFIVRNAEGNIAALAEQNPMDWLADRPHTYAGAFDGAAPPEAAPPRSWYYDRSAHELVYRAERTRHLHAPDNPEHDIRFRVRVEQGLLDPDAPPEAALHGVRMMQFEPITPYDWQVFAN